jgi:peptidoglycan/LPS O-acetylase OafA/YrhL
MTVLAFSLKRFDFIVYALNLQFIFSPVYVKPLLTLWYLSVVFSYYVIFGLFLSQRSRSLIVWAIVVFVASYFFSYKYELFDDRFFEYFFVFLAGILLARNDMLREKIFHAPLIVQLTVGLIGAILFGIFEFGDYRVRSVGYLFSSNLYILSWAILALRLFRESWINWRIWHPISYASFFAYLLHRPIWEIMFAVIKFPEYLYSGWYRLLPGSIFVFVISYYLQLAYDLLLKAGSGLWARLTLKSAQPGD